MIKVNDIYQGRLYQRGRFADCSLVDKLDLLEQKEIEAVVNMSNHSDPELAEAIGDDRYLHMHIADGKNFDFVRLELAVGFGAKALLRAPGKAVLSHCYAGRNRSGILNACLLIDVFGMSGAEAVRQVQTARPNSLANQTFVEYILARRKRN